MDAVHDFLCSERLKLNAYTRHAPFSPPQQQPPKRANRRLLLAGAPPAQQRIDESLARLEVRRPFGTARLHRRLRRRRGVDLAAALIELQARIEVSEGAADKALNARIWAFFAAGVEERMPTLPEPAETGG